MPAPRPWPSSSNSPTWISDDADWLEELGLAYCRFGDAAQELGDPRAEHAFIRYEDAFEG